MGDEHLDEEAALNEGLEADAADARAAAAEGVAAAAAAGEPNTAAAPAAPAPAEPESDDDDGAPEAEDVDGLLTRPPHSTEVFLSGLARSMSEEEVRAVAAPHGEVFELRLLKDGAGGTNRGYAFVQYCRREDAAAAVEALHNAEVKGRRVRASLTPAKHRLFVGGLPKERFTLQRLEKLLRRAVVGIEAVELPSDAPGHTRGFAFVDFRNTAAAEKARRVLGAPPFAVRGRAVSVSWAEPRGADDAAAAAAVKSVYVSNLPDGAKPEELKAAFEQFGDVERVVIPAPRQAPPPRAPPPGAAPSVASPPAPPPRPRYCFVHFVDRAAALAAADAAEKPELGGCRLEVELAKPMADGSNVVGGAAGALGGMPRVPGAPPGAAAAAAASRGPLGAGGIGPRGGGQRGPPQYAGAPPGMPPHAMPMAPGMALTPMVMPNGQIAYVLAQPGGGMPGAPPPPPPPYMGAPGPPHHYCPPGPHGYGGRGGGRGPGYPGGYGGRGVGGGGRYRPY